MSLLLAPVVRARRLFSPRLERVSPFSKGNALAESRSLNRAGYSSAAVAMARMAVERRLHEIAVQDPRVAEPGTQKGIGRYCTIFIARGVLRRHESQVIESFADKASKIVHGTKTTKLHARKLIVHAARVLSMLEGRGV